MKKKFLYFIILFFFIFCSKNLPKSILDGTTNIQYISDHLVFHDEGSDGYYMAQGFVRLNNGFTVISTCTAFLDTFISVSGDIDLRNTGQIELLSDLRLDTSVTFTGAGGMINARGNVIYLDNNLNLPDNYILNITGNTIIDGNGHNLVLGKWANITIDDSITLTLRNLTLKNTYTNYTVPPIIPSSIKSMVTFDNIEISLFDDFSFNQGKLFIHNDVDITGTYKFSYRSTQPMLIESNSCLYFDKDTTFEFYPSCTNNSLFTMQDKSSILYLDGCTLQTTLTGMILTKGQLYLDNNVTFSSIDDTYLYDLTVQGSIIYGRTDNSSFIASSSWSPNGLYLAITGADPTGITTNNLQIYRFDRYNTQYITSYNFGSDFHYNSKNGTSWHPSGKYLSVGGPASPAVQIYKFDESTLTLLTSIDFSDTNVWATKWHPSGKYLAVTGDPKSGNDTVIYEFKDQTLTTVASANYNGGGAVFTEWSPNGNYLAIGGGTPDPVGQDLKLYYFNGNSLTFKDSVDHLGGNKIFFSAKWSPDGQFLAIGGTSSSNYIFAVLAFRYISEKLSLTCFGAAPDEVHTLNWSNNGKFIIEGGITKRNFNIWNFTGNSLIFNANLSKYFGYSTFSANFLPNDKFINIAGTPNTASIQPTGHIYKLNYKYDTTPQALSQTIKLGNSQLGSDYDIDVTLLGGNYNQLYGSVFYDNVN
ncbi:WD40 repeat domain-containing protein [Candidatus Babeliales bacterium]|nr:WD40 repeat domain-containing protein [Candidatus Babeliales bacterium]